MRWCRPCLTGKDYSSPARHCRPWRGNRSPMPVYCAWYPPATGLSNDIKPTSPIVALPRLFAASRQHLPMAIADGTACRRLRCSAYHSGRRMCCLRSISAFCSRYNRSASGMMPVLPSGQPDAATPSTDRFCLAQSCFAANSAHNLHSITVATLRSRNQFFCQPSRPVSSIALQPEALPAACIICIPSGNRSSAPCPPANCNPSPSCRCRASRRLSPVPDGYCHAQTRPIAYHRA